MKAIRLRAASKYLPLEKNVTRAEHDDEVTHKDPGDNSGQAQRASPMSSSAAPSPTPPSMLPQPQNCLPSWAHILSPHHHTNVVLTKETGFGFANRL